MTRPEEFYNQAPPKPRRAWSSGQAVALLLLLAVLALAGAALAAVFAGNAAEATPLAVLALVVVQLGRE